MILYAVSHAVVAFVVIKALIAYINALKKAKVLGDDVAVAVAGLVVVAKGVYLLHLPPRRHPPSRHPTMPPGTLLPRLSPLRAHRL